jgi:hypothetical protein
VGNLTIEETTVLNWQATTTAPVLRVFYNETFTTPEGTVVAAGNHSGWGVAYDDIQTTLVDGNIVIPEFTIPSTTDGVDRKKCASDLLMVRQQQPRPGRFWRIP